LAEVLVVIMVLAVEEDLVVVEHTATLVELTQAVLALLDKETLVELVTGILDSLMGHMEAAEELVLQEKVAVLVAVEVLDYKLLEMVETGQVLIPLGELQLVQA
jgi:hypothetical protein